MPSARATIRMALGATLRRMAEAPIGRELGPDEFLAWEREQTERHLYVRGEIWAMAGGSPRHNHLAARVIALLAGSLEKTCRTFSSDQKIGLPEDDFVYSDAVVICGALQMRPGATDVVTNPAVVVEILSKSTESYDRGDQQRGDLALPSVRHYVLVSQRELRVEIYTRQDDGSFRFEVLGSGAKVGLDRIGVTIDVDDLYGDSLSLPGD